MACVALPCVAVAQNPQPAPPHETHPVVALPSGSQPNSEQQTGQRSRNAATTQGRSWDPGAVANEQQGHNAGDTAARHPGRQSNGCAEVIG